MPGHISKRHQGLVGEGNGRLARRCGGEVEHDRVGRERSER